ncbi:MAG: sigma-70 family RNA polymerase sigma factor [Phycisphaerales bacterium]|nr:MAG: sigma-70 family RNA polymerase sigma factor [Phycisphaerales bacterium]
MIDDELLKWKFKQGSTEALSCIYQKYLDDLLTLAVGLLNDPVEAEDVVQDVFVSFAQLTKNFKLRGSLKAYLATSVVNRVRDRIRKRRTKTLGWDRNGPQIDLRGPDQSLIYSEQWQRLIRLLDELPYQQREAVLLRLRSEMKFREIAKAQNVSVHTAIARYKCGLNRLRYSLNGGVKK